MRLEGVESFYPLSPMQQGMLFHSVSAPGSPMYWQQATLTLEGSLDVPRFVRAWESVIERHAVLRSYFLWEGLREPVQVVQRRGSLPFEEHDWRGVAPDQQAARLEALLAADRARGCELHKPPLLRLGMVRVADQLQHIVWSFHHILLDGWSVYRVLKEAIFAYDALAQGGRPEWESSRPYQDFIAWLRRQDLAAAGEFWRRELQGFAEPTSVLDALRTGGAPASPEEAADHETVTIHVEEDVAAGLQALARRHQLTLNTVFQGTWALLLSRYGAGQDVCFGATVSGRPAEFEGADSAVGVFINTLPVRVAVHQSAELLPWLKRLQERQAEARQYDWTPLVEIQGWSGVPRDRPLFDNILIFANYPLDSWSSAKEGSLQVKGFRTWESTNYAINAFAQPGPPLALGVFYDRRRCDASAIDRLLGHWRVLLAAVAARPESRLADLPLLTSREQRQILLDWNATAVERDEACLPQLFQAQARRTPDAPAAAFAGETCTYAELARRAGHMASHLRSLGVGPETLVGIYMERSLEMLVALLGVLEAGAAYVPLDPAYPKDRVAFMLEDSGAAILLTQSSLLGSLPASVPKVVCVDKALEAEATASPARSISGDDVAYVIYTSGSTGRPKGVQVTHRALANFLCSMQREPGLAAGDVLLSVTTLSFDIAGLELYLPLIAGGQVVLVSREEVSDGERLRDRLQRSGATVMQATPATWRLLLEAGWRGDGRLKVICGGESLTRELAEQLLARAGSVWNMYGPTETTIWSTLWKVEPGDGPISIGRPIANTQLYLLDAAGRPVPVGVPGELCIGGTGLARGYWKRPELTADRFVPDPFLAGGAARLYRTGDLARYLPDGRIEWLGRIDHQIKLRGYRIELGEIESALVRHPEVQRAVAVVREDHPGDRRLVAYLVRRADGAPEEEPSGLSTRLRRFLQELLPDYMVPAWYVVLDTLPLTPNGKVDRKALPEPEAPAQDARGYVAPQSEIEQVIAGVWQELLRLERVGLHDNFFDSGGHSLLLMQVQGRLRQALQRDIPIVDLFRYPTVGALGRHLREQADGHASVAEDGALERLQEGRKRLDRLQQRRRQQQAPEQS